MIYVVIVVLTGLVGAAFLFVSQATLGVAFLALGCYFGIILRVIQADVHQHRLIQRLAASDETLAAALLTKCPHCHRTIRSGAGACPICGRPVTRAPAAGPAPSGAAIRCPGCYNTIKAGVAECPICGRPLSSIAST